MRFRRWTAVFCTTLLLALVQVAPSAAQTAKCKGETANIVGTDRKDEIGGTQNRDVIVAGKGDDDILGRGGNDLICAGRGSDRIHGGGGSDRILGEQGSDYLIGAAGNDTLKTGPGILHFMEGMGGNDRLTGNELLAIAIYERSRSAVTVDLGQGTVRGEGRDRLRRISWVTGSKHNDTMRGSGGSDILLGSTGNDVLISGGNSGSIRDLKTLGVRTAAVQADLLDGDGVFDPTDVRQPGNDTLRGGKGLTIVSYATSSESMNVDMNKGTASGQGNDTLEDIQLVAGSTLDDTLKGGDGADAFEGEAGDDDINGRDGNDTIVYLDSIGVEADLRAGDATATYVLLTAGTASQVESTDTLSNFENIIGSLGADSLVGDGGDNEAFGISGNDSIEGAAGDDLLIGGPGNDSVDGGDGTDSCDGEDETNCERVAREENATPAGLPLRHALRILKRISQRGFNPLIPWPAR